MTKTTLQLNSTIATALLLLLGASVAQAATVFPTSGKSSYPARDTFVVDVRLDSEGAAINAVEGTVEISSSQPLTVNDIVLGGSDLTLWTSKPSLSQSGNLATITYTGGTPGGFTKDNALVMRLAISAADVGQLQITPKSTKAYLNDGQGTPVTAAVRDLKLTVSAPAASPTDGLNEIISKDTEPPNEFEISLGRDESVNDGKYFISFQATDAGSGIDHYEVKEGGGSTVRSGTTYVLIDQSLSSDISVTAYDKAGNARVMAWKQTGGGFWSKLVGRLTILLAGIGLLAILWFGGRALRDIFRKLWAKHKNKQQ